MFQNSLYLSWTHPILVVSLPKQGDSSDYNAIARYFNLEYYIFQSFWYYHYAGIVSVKCGN